MHPRNGLFLIIFGEWGVNFGELPFETVQKLPSTGQTPHHHTGHSHVDERFARSGKPLVILAHPPVLVQPRKRPLHDPPTWQDDETPRWHELLPVYLHALFGPLPGPLHQHILRSRLARPADDLHAPPERLLYPVCALVFSCVASVHP